MPLWVWNCEISERRITEMLEQYAARGVGGVFVHARPGLITEYLSGRWFDLWRHAVRECTRLGLQCHIYDENSYPSGFAGGHVVAQDPRAVAQTLVAVGREGDRLLTEVRDAEPDLFHAGFGYVDLARPEPTQLFIEKTHAQYARHFQSDFGQTIRYVFTDEPEIGNRKGLVWSPHLREEFRREHGYDVQDRLTAFVDEAEASYAVRFDFQWTVQRLFTTHHLRPVHDWCTAHGLAYTGHFNEHEWPSPARLPDVMAALRWLQVPGNDLLGFQFKPSQPDANGLYLLNLTELRSVANQLGRERVLCETAGGGGYGFALADLKSLDDFALAHGVNLINPHLSYASLAGARKYDWPQTLSDHSPWWDAYGGQADHVARVVTALRAGRQHNRILLLHPTTSAWIHHRPEWFGATGDALKPIRDEQVGLVQSLQDGCYDFELGNELIMAELGQVRAGRMCVGESDFEVVIVPAAMENLLDRTVELLRAFADAGGTILALGEPPAYVRGRPSPLPRAITMERCDSTARLLERLHQLVPQRFQVPPGLCVMRRECPDGAVLYFMANPWLTEWSGTIDPGAGTVTELDTATGRTMPRGQGPRQELRLPPRGHALWLVQPGSARAPERDVGPWQDAVLGPATAERAVENVLALDYCDLLVGGNEERGLPTIVADQRNWRAQGFPQNMWQNSIQYQRRFLEAKVDPDLGFTARYRFTVADDTTRALALAIERPWLYRITVNGRDLSFAGAARWWDEDIRRAGIGHLVCQGENVVELTARPFHVLCEIAPIYALGDFAVDPAPSGFALQPARRIVLGDWRHQGLPFYPWAVRYQFPVSLAETAHHLAVDVPAWAGSVVYVRWDDRACGSTALPPYRVEWGGTFAKGEHRLTIEVAGNLKNLLGPHFSDGLPGAWSWLYDPQPQPPGRDYRFCETGLLAAPQLWTSR
jgi:hypothetical protein